MATITKFNTLPLSKRLEVARIGASMKQVDLAARVGVSRATIAAWENGYNEPRLGDAVRLANATGVTLEWLAEGVEHEKTPAANDGGLDEWRAPRDSNPRPSDP